MGGQAKSKRKLSHQRGDNVIRYGLFFYSMDEFFIYEVFYKRNGVVFVC